MNPADLCEMRLTKRFCITWTRLHSYENNEDTEFSATH